MSAAHELGRVLWNSLRLANGTRWCEEQPNGGLQGLASCSWRSENGAAALREGHSFSFGSNEKWVSSCSPDCRVVTAPQMKLRGAEEEYDEP